MTMNNEKQGLNVGVDVGKFQLDLFIYERDLYFSVQNNEQGIREAIKRLKRYRLSRAVLEATGRYEMAFAIAANDRGLPISVVRPVLIRQYIA